MSSNINTYKSLELYDNKLVGGQSMHCANAAHGATTADMAKSCNNTTGCKWNPTYNMCTDSSSSGGDGTWCSPGCCTSACGDSCVKSSCSECNHDANLACCGRDNTLPGCGSGPGNTCANFPGCNLPHEKLYNSENECVCGTGGTPYNSLANCCKSTTGHRKDLCDQFKCPTGSGPGPGPPHPKYKCSKKKKVCKM